MTHAELLILLLAGMAAIAAYPLFDLLLGLAADAVDLIDRAVTRR